MRSPPPISFPNGTILDVPAGAVDEKTASVIEFLKQPAKPIIEYVEETDAGDDPADAIEFLEAARDIEAAKKKPRVTVMRAILKRLAELGGD